MPKKKELNFIEILIVITVMIIIIGSIKQILN